MYREKNFLKFWENAISDLKKVNIKPEFHPNNKKTTDTFNVYSVHYTGFQKSQADGELLMPVNAAKPRVIIHLHDYNHRMKYRQDSLDNRFAHFFLTLRGHSNLPTRDEKEPASPGYMTENIMDIERYYVTAVYLDAYRVVEMLRLNQELDCSIIGIIGKGLGAASALFTAAYSKRICALVLETPSFCHLNLSQNLSTGDAANEINNLIIKKGGKKKLIKTNLSYFDGINLSDMIKCPVLVTVGLKDTISPPECIFALFNHLKTEKTVEVYPEEGNSAGGNVQMKKSMAWMAGKLSSI